MVDRVASDMADMGKVNQRQEVYTCRDHPLCTCVEANPPHIPCWGFCPKFRLGRFVETDLEGLSVSLSIEIRIPGSKEGLVYSYNIFRADTSSIYPRFVDILLAILEAHRSTNQPC